MNTLIDPYIQSKPRSAKKDHAFQFNIRNSDLRIRLTCLILSGYLTY